MENIQKINVQLDEIKMILSKSNLSLIECDIVLSKLQSVYIDVNNIQIKPIQENIKEGKTFEPETHQKETLSANHKKKTSTKSAIKPESKVETEHTEPIFEVEEHTTSIPEVTNPELIEKPEITLKQNQDHKIVADKFHKNEPLINELIAKQATKKDISSVMQSKPIKDIEAAIGVNERFIFIKELFNGDAETYVKTITILNNAHNFNEAFNYINQTFSWDFESGSAHKLLDLVRRKHIIDAE
jgi:hypothetical protein